MSGIETTKTIIKNSKKKFITGATGYVGRNFVDSLVKNGHIVYVLTRKESSFFSNNKNINVIVGDITDKISLPPDIGTIYHCAGVIYQPKEMEKVNVLGTQNIIDIALKNKCKLIHLSSAGVAGKTKEFIIDENTICNPQNAYELSKYEAEQIVTDAVIKKGLQAQILRPTTIFGVKENPETDSFFQLAKSMRNGYYKNIGRGIYNIVHIDEVVKAMELLDEANIPNGGIYILNNPIAYKDMDSLIKNLNPIIIKKTQTIPYSLVYIAAMVLTAICFIAKRKNPLTFSRLKALTNKRIYSQNKITETLPFKNTLAVEKYIKKVCEEYINLKLLP